MDVTSEVSRKTLVWPVRPKSCRARGPSRALWPTRSALWQSTRPSGRSPAILGLPMGMADVATALWTRFLKFDAADPRWPDRDRFVLSAGHGSMLLYALIYLTGHDGMSIDDIRNFRQLHSPAAGHPEYGQHPAIETTTGPLGQGSGNRRRHGDRRTQHGGPLRQIAGGSPHLGHRLRRRPDGGHQPRGGGAGRPSRPVQADGPVRRQPRLDRRRHRAVLSRTTC